MSVRPYRIDDVTSWDWRAEYRGASAEHGYDGEWQITAYPEGGNSPVWLASLGPGSVPEDERVARFMAAAPQLYTALLFAMSALKCNEPWTERCAAVIGRALAKAEGLP